MTDLTSATRKRELRRQLMHWSHAAAKLEELDSFASPGAWASLGRYLGLAIVQELRPAIARLRADAAELTRALDEAATLSELDRIHQRLLALRQRYLQTETLLDFFGQAINTRTDEQTGRALAACDEIAHRSMRELLAPLQMTPPPVLTFLDQGLGASILKAGLRLWDGSTINPVSVVKIARHNLYRPTAAIHEAGHQVAHMLDWNEEFADALNKELADSSELARLWSGWASEIAADAIAFVHTGYAAVAALHDVVAGEYAGVFSLNPGDPHPVSYLRVLLGVAMCRCYFGSGPWDDLANHWRQSYPLAQADTSARAVIEGSLPLLERVARLSLEKPYHSFRKRSLAALVDPRRVSPSALAELETRAGPSLWTSIHWIWNEPLRLLALGGLRLATEPQRGKELFDIQENWMSRLGQQMPILFTENARTKGVSL